MKELGVSGFILGIGAMIMILVIATSTAREDHTHEPTGIQVGSTICLEFGTLHYPDPMDGFDSHIDAAFCGEVVLDEEERFPPLGSNTHLAQ